jgi:hypothetical protein
MEGMKEQIRMNHQSTLRITFFDIAATKLNARD